MDRALTRFAETGQGNVIYITKPRESYRLRVRDWRVFFGLDRATATLTVIAIRHRGKAYKER